MKSEEHGDLTQCLKPLVAQICEAMTIWTATTETKQRQKELVHTSLGALRKQVYVTDEKYLGMASASDGTGTAYIFLFIEALIDAGVHIGLSRGIAQELVIQTILGSTLTVERTGKHPANLRNMVTSPGRTTAGALLQLEKGRFRSLVLEAVAAAYEEAKRF